MPRRVSLFILFNILLTISILLRGFSDETLILSRLTETEKTRHFLILREKLGIDKPLVVANTSLNLDKKEKEAVNLVARASGEGRAITRPHSASSKVSCHQAVMQAVSKLSRTRMSRGT